MQSITTKDGTEIFYKDWGPKTPSPSCFITAGRSTADDWDAQMLFFLEQGLSRRRP